MSKMGDNSIPRMGDNSKITKRVNNQINPEHVK